MMNGLFLKLSVPHVENIQGVWPFYRFRYLSGVQNISGSYPRDQWNWLGYPKGFQFNFLKKDILHNLGIRKISGKVQCYFLCTYYFIYVWMYLYRIKNFILYTRRLLGPAEFKLTKKKVENVWLIILDMGLYIPGFPA